MKFAAALSALALAGAAVAQNTSVTVNVGASSGDFFVFTPPNITASKGSVVTFTFSGTPGNHSITQSSFANPCVPLSDGFDSGNIQIPTGMTTGFPTWNLTITDDSKPIWFFCKQVIPQAHCSSGMVGSINAANNGSNTYDAFLAAAKTFKGNPVQSVGFLVGEGASASAAPGPINSGVTAFGTPSLTAPASAASTGSGSGSGTSGAAPSTTNAAGVAAKANGLLALFAVAAGVAFA